MRTHKDTQKKQKVMRYKNLKKSIDLKEWKNNGK